MTMTGDQQSHVCTLCGRRTYACVSVPGGIACPTCKRRLREERCAAGLDQPLPNCECARCRKPRAKPVTPAESKPVEPDPPPDPDRPSLPKESRPGVRRAGVLATPAERAVRPRSRCPYVECAPADDDLGQLPDEMIEDPPSIEALDLPTRNRARTMTHEQTLAYLAQTQRTFVDPQSCTCVRGSDGPDPSCPEHGEPLPPPTEEYGAEPRSLTPPPEWDEPLPELEPDEAELADRQMFERDCGATPELAARFARIAREGRERAAVARRLYEQAGEVAEGWPDTRAVWADALRQLTRIGRRGD